MITTSLKSFESFLKKEIQPAISELDQLNDNSRKHIQKLIYTNLVDRFDVMVDKIILDNIHEQEIIDIATKNMDKPVIESDLIKLLIGKDRLESMIDEWTDPILMDTQFRAICSYSRGLR